MEHINPEKAHDLDKLFERSNWDMSDSPKLLLVPTSPAVGRDSADDLESWLMSQGLMGITHESTSPPYHQVLEGIEGWELDLESMTYTRLDDFTVRWKSFGVKTPTASLSQLRTLFGERPGQVASAKFGV